MYNPRLARFFTVDPIAASYPMLTPYQFASNSPISGVDLDGLEHYMTIDGQYLGKPKSSKNEELRIVTSDDAKKYANNVEQIHSNAQYKTLPVQGYNLEAKEVTYSSMTFDHFLDLAHIIYSEGPTSKADMFSHLLFNREIEFSLKAKKLDGQVIKNVYSKDKTKLIDQVRRTPDNDPILRGIDDYGFKDYVLFGTHKPNSEKALEDYKSTLRTTGVQIDGGVQNMNYYNFFAVKNSVPDLLKNIKPITSIFKAIINARLGITKDMYPNYESWYKATPKNDIQDVQSDPETKPEGNKKN
jgi:hypothetical protein